MKKILLALLMFLPVQVYAASSSEFPAKTRADLTATITIADSTTVSQAIDLYGTQLVGIFVPSTFDGTALTFTASDTLAGTYLPVDIDQTSSSAYTVTTAASKYAPLTNPDVFRGLRFIKIVTSSAQTTTNTVFILATRPLN